MKTRIRAPHHHALDIIGLFRLEYLPESPVVPQREVTSQVTQPGPDPGPRCVHLDRMVRPCLPADGR